LIENVDRVVALLAEDSRVLAERVVDRNPWICARLGVDLAVWAPPLLAAHGLQGATLRIIGSGATGFSLDVDKAGQPFRRVGGGAEPSDLDVAVVHQGLFDECWDDMVEFDRFSRLATRPWNREGVYWGHIDDYCVPDRSGARRRLRDLANAIRRSPTFRGYPCNVRMYRSREDLLGYVTSSIKKLERSVRQ
jgi:hypothetical protein